MVTTTSSGAERAHPLPGWKREWLFWRWMTRPANTYTYEMMRQLDAAILQGRDGMKVFSDRAARRRREDFLCRASIPYAHQRLTRSSSTISACTANETLFASRTDAQAGRLRD